jgi:hypothetical protein
MVARMVYTSGFTSGFIVTNVGRDCTNKDRRCRTMVEIKIDKDKFDKRVEEIMRNAIRRAYDLKVEPSDQQERKQ